METITNKACGLDVHQKSITACIMRQGIKKQIRDFGTTTRQLESLKAWLHKNEITHVAMESTGVYWKPVFNIIGEEFKLILVNARHIKNVPGRKTDVQDSEWICKLLRAGLLKGSFIPSEEIRQVRNLTRYQKQLQHQIQNEKNRVHKLLQEANIKITSVLSDIFCVSGSKILKDLSKGITSAKELSVHMDCDKRLRRKKEEAIEALEGRFTSNHQFMLKAMLDHLSFIEEKISSIEEEIKLLVKDHQKDHELLQTVPGIKSRAANTIIAEIGSNMDFFPNEHHISSWAGLCPGNNESAGKKRSSRITHGNKWLRSMLVECAWCAVRQKDTYLRSKYYRLIPRMGKKKALIAIAHKMLKACYFILKNKEEYKDLGASYLDGDNKDKLKSHYIKKLSMLGFETELKPIKKVS